MIKTMIFAPQKNLTKLVLPRLQLLLAVPVPPDNVVVGLRNLVTVDYIDLFVPVIMCLLSVMGIYKNFENL